MFTVSNLEKSLDISEMVAKNDLRIHVEFVRAQRMGELVQRIQQSSVKILQLSQRDWSCYFFLSIPNYVSARLLYHTKGIK